jgi:hypothetical protein
MRESSDSRSVSMRTFHRASTPLNVICLGSTSEPTIAETLAGVVHELEADRADLQCSRSNLLLP